MKKSIYYFPMLLFFSVSGCIKPEADNMEADIIEVAIPDSVLISPPAITNTTVAAFVNYEKLDITAFAPEFVLTEGATISPASGTKQDFTAPVTYTVTSEDGAWKKEYKVSLLQNTVTDTFGFENWELTPEANYYTPYEIVFGEDQNVWASGNSGFSLIAQNKVPEAYPTQRTSVAVEGSYAAYLETMSTGALGAIVSMPLAAGNLFLGTFDGAKALTAPLEATLFGIPFNKKPLRFTGSYKYISGGAVKDRNGETVSPSRNDRCDIYAVLFKSSKEKPYLNGSNVLTDASVIAVAQLADGNSTSGTDYHTFDIPFQYRGEINEADLVAYGYKLSIIFTTSVNGAVFEGAVGSKLYVDKVKIVTE